MSGVSEYLQICRTFKNSFKFSHEMRKKKNQVNQSSLLRIKANKVECTFTDSTRLTLVTGCWHKNAPDYWPWSGFRGSTGHSSIWTRTRTMSRTRRSRIKVSSEEEREREREGKYQSQEKFTFFLSAGITQFDLFIFFDNQCFRILSFHQQHQQFHAILWSD